MIDLSIRVSPSRNVQGSGAFKKLGGFIKPLGNEAFLIADEIVTSLVDCIFRRIPATDSDPKRPPIPMQSGHPFRFIPAGHSDANRPPLKG